MDDQKQPKISRVERLSLQASKNVMEKKKAVQEAKPRFLTEAHRLNYEKGMEYIRESKILEIDWEKEIERQKKNARND